MKLSNLGMQITGFWNQKVEKGVCYIFHQSGKQLAMWFTSTQRIWEQCMFLHFLLQLYLPASHCTPVYPPGHWHKNPLTASRQADSSMHGDELHSSISTANKGKNVIWLRFNIYILFYIYTVKWVSVIDMHGLCAMTTLV